MEKNNSFNKSGWWILASLSLVPLALWIFSMPFFARFSSLSASAKSLGDIFGLCGMAMFSLVMILSARLKFFERFFNGINNAYQAHHFFGGLSFCLLLFHPLLLAYNYLQVSFLDGALFLLPGSNWAQNFGILGLFIMIVTLVITFYTKLKYQVWKFTHKFLGIAFIFAFLHTFMSSGDISTNLTLKIYLFILGIAAISAFLYRSLLSKYLVKNFDYTVKNIAYLPDNMYEIELSPGEEEMQFTAGQFAFIKFYNQAISKEPHPFSMSSFPGSNLKFAIKELGDYTKKISSLRSGDKVKIEGPYGKFNFKNYENKNQIWVAGGIGITPFLSMARSLCLQDSDYKITLYYSAKTESLFSFKEELEKIANSYKNFSIIFWTAEKNGFLTAEKIKTHNPSFSECDVLVCGPPAMMSSIKKQLLNLGILKNKIHMEEFQLY